MGSRRCDIHRHDLSMERIRATFRPAISVRETAKLLGVTPATTYTWIRSGEIPSLKLGGRIRVPTAPLARLLGMDPEDLVREQDASDNG